MTASVPTDTVPERNLWNKFVDLLELIRFSHTVFALPFALLSALLAWQTFPFRWQHLLGILLCMVFARSAAMAFNRLVDRHFDAKNPRTAIRHLPAGILPVGLVTGFTMFCIVSFVVSTLLFLPNLRPLWLSIPVMLFLLSYSYAKRWTSLCHYWLSTALMLSPIATWIAITGELSPPPVWLAAVIFFWVGGFDILYATQDAEFDRNEKLHSIPAKVGIPNALRIAAVSHLITVFCLFGFARAADLNGIFLAAIFVIAVLLIYEHWLVRPDNLTRVNIAFFNVNALISVGLLFAAVAEIVRRSVL